VRSRAAASVLRTAGFQTTFSMAGGIKAWEGRVAAGPPEAGVAFFTPAADAGELIALAWLLEEGSRKFYSAVADMQRSPEAARLFFTLVKAEEHHKEMLWALYREIAGTEPGPDFPRNLAVAQGADDRMEGNVGVSEALAWAKGKGAQDLLEVSMALETDSYDRYIKMGMSVPGEKAQKVLTKLVAEEKEHLSRMAELLDRSVTGG
jgi:rubrerythrin